VPKQDGSQVRMSLDLVVQEAVEIRLEQAVREFNARGARALVVDVETGDILAMADVLRTQPRKGFLEVIPADDRDKHPSLGRNRCATDPYEPGSTFKPFVWSAATEFKRARPDEVLPLPSSGPYTTSRGRTIRDVKPMGAVTWRTVLIKSLNSGMAYVGERMTAAELQDAVRRFGFGRATGSGVPGESWGLVTSPKNWTHYTQTSVPMGQEISVTPLQMIRAFSAFCRDGTLVDLRLALPDDPGREPVVVPQRAVTEPIARMTRDAMRMVMTDGTGRKAQSSRYQMFGKSGTAQLPIPKALEKKVGHKGFFQDRYTASFIAGAPFRNPRIAVLVVIDDPDRSKQHFGGLTAGPVARDIIDQTLSYLGVEPDLEEGAQAVDEGGN
jgi:cell division protein FtsI (penicillin-binding protein 3)